MMKKVLAAFLTLSLALAPVGGFVFQDNSTYVSAKSYKSGKKSFNSGTTNNNSNFQNNNNSTTSNSTTTNKAKTTNNRC